MTGSQIAAQFTALVSSYGETITLNTGGTARGVRALLEPANSAVIQTYFDDNAAVGLVRPCVQAFFDATMSGTGTPPQINDTFTRDGRPFTVVKIQNHRLGGVIVLIAALCD